jgi:hypothetical protein
MAGNADEFLWLPWEFAVAAWRRDRRDTERSPGTTLVLLGGPDVLDVATVTQHTSAFHIAHWTTTHCSSPMANAREADVTVLDRRSEVRYP